MDIPDPLSGKFVGSIAYKTIKDRLPVILAKVVDTLCQMKHEVIQTHGEEGHEELKKVVGRISKLRNEVQTNKDLEPLMDGLCDVTLWNCYLEDQIREKGSAPRWFEDPWLYVECYMYRRIVEAIELSPVISYIDPFRPQKANSLLSSQNAVIALLSYLKSILDSEAKNENLEELFSQFVQVSLWGNRCDLSISAQAENAQKTNLLMQLKSLHSNIIIDHRTSVWRTLTNLDNFRVDIILDNAGFELITDLLLAEFVLSTGLAQKVYLHGKAMPWFVSDVVKYDFDWTLDTLCSSDNDQMSYFGKRWKNRLSDGSFIFTENLFWSLPYDYSSMESVLPDLYKELANSKIIIIKGDLNYRKLTGDRRWDTTTEYDKALRGFHPAPHVALRTLKADVIVGLQPGQAKSIQETNEDWMAGGEYGVIQFSAS